jgi:alpha,alpha-trehalase
MTTAGSLPSALDAWDAVVERLRGVAPVLFLDYDGTLTPIVARPEEAILAAASRDVVRSVAALCPVTIVSGRDRTVVEELVGLPGLGYVGSHGFDISGPPQAAVRHEVGAEHLESLESAEAMLRDRLAGISGAAVERKRFGIAAHYRRSRDHREEVERAVREVLATQPDLVLASGKAVFELRPATEWDKGRAIRWLLDRWPAHGTPLHIGDDLTDETVFEMLARDGLGVGIVVTDDDRPTAAQFSLRSPGGVLDFLGRLVRVLESM